MANKYLALDAIRGIAAILVVIRHTPGMWNGWTFDVSYLAVDLFFVLSGFVIARSYESKLHTGALTPASFTVKRIVRIYPMFFIGALVILLVGLIDRSAIDRILHSDTSPLDYLFLFLMAPNPGAAYPFPLNGPVWSLFFELVVNAIYAATFALRKGRRAVELLLTLMSAAILIECARTLGTIDHGYAYDTLHIGLARTTFCFYMGVYAWRLKQRCAFTFKPRTMYILPVLLAVMCTPVLVEHRPYFDLAAAMLVFPALTFVASHASVSSVEAAIYDCLGKISYPLYVLHCPLYLLLTTVMAAHGTAFPKEIATGPVFLLVSGAIALFLLKHYDEPVRSALSRAIDQYALKRPDTCITAINCSKPL